MAELKGILEQIANITSKEIAEELAKVVGGTEIYIPKDPKETSLISQIIGIEHAQIIAEKIGYGKISIPAGEFRGQGARTKYIESLLSRGYPVNLVARLADCGERTVWNIKAKTEKKIKEKYLRLPF